MIDTMNGSFLLREGKHKGAIDPKTGKIYKPADPEKHLNVK
jgi:hypothetical protein